MTPGIDPDVEAQLHEKLALFTPGHTATSVEWLSPRQAWGYTIGPGKKLQAFSANLSCVDVWTISPVYSRPNM